MRMSNDPDPWSRPSIRLGECGELERDQSQMVVFSWQQRGSVTVECGKREPGPAQQRRGINMRDGTSTADGTKSAGLSPLHLRVGVFLILLWLLPFWALAPRIAHSLSGLSNPPSVAALTTTIVVVQTIIGLLGFWVAGTEVKSIIKGSTKRHALGAIWSILLHGDIRDHDGIDLKEERPPRDDV
jgi:hypothetical protein